MNTATLLLSTFLLAVTALLAFIWSLRKGLADPDPDAARVIFEPGEIGRHDAGPLPPRAEDIRWAADRSTAAPVRLMLVFAVLWLLVASLAGLTSSIKLHAPDWAATAAWLSFGRIRTLHLNAVAYGWTPMAALGIALWMLPRLLRTELVGGGYAVAGTMLWNLALLAGLACIALGISDGMEWLEIPWQIGLVFAVAGALIAIPLLLTLRNRRVEHLYVSVWYIGAALFWFPVLYVVAKWPGLHFGVEAATMNWWFGHNVLGLFYTPLSLAAVYYFLPKVIGRPVQSYNLSLVGFWCLAFFYGQVGGHHLIGGPVPEWLVTLSIVQSMMMVVPVLAFTVNQHQTMRGHFAVLNHSPTLRFVVLGGMMYTLSSVQGSLEALRGINTITHFTHFTVAHAHLGLYGFVTMVMFGAIYFALPRVVGREWPWPRLVAAHFWLVMGGFAVYFTALTIGGWLQGLAMLDASRPFIDSVRVTLPWLQGRTVGGAIMTLGHVLFALHVGAMVLGLGPRREGAVDLYPAPQAS
ncbi:cbb3-type cytochrome c oxidase subunit I [Arenimonas sp.]|uniref:cbb3-type cytochrome c oxidase subunit I n=1 Tax=Arenimonas sp. TaxID=1872635 RepID=UPI0035B389ED